MITNIVNETLETGETLEFRLSVNTQLIINILENDSNNIRRFDFDFCNGTPLFNLEPWGDTLSLVPNLGWG